MGVAHLLPDFGAPGTAVPTPSGPSQDEIEALTRDSYETGYKAGWDDSVKAQNEEAGRISADLARNLQDLSFTYHEARTQMLKDLRPLLEQLVDLVLPELARETLSARIVQEIHAHAEAGSASQVRILAAPDSRLALDRLCDEDFGFPIQIAEDPDLGTGQVLLKFATGERQIDMDELLSGIRSAVAGFFEDNLGERAHG